MVCRAACCCHDDDDGWMDANHFFVSRRLLFAHLWHLLTDPTNYRVLVQACITPRQCSVILSNIEPCAGCRATRTRLLPPPRPCAPCPSIIPSPAPCRKSINQSRKQKSKPLLIFLSQHHNTAKQKGKTIIRLALKTCFFISPNKKTVASISCSSLDTIDLAICRLG